MEIGFSFDKLYYLDETVNFKHKDIQ